MASKTQEPLHFVLFPLMAAGHMIPMIDISKLLAQRGVIVTVITTPRNAYLLHNTVARASESGLQIRVIELIFPSVEAGLPEGCENFDKLPSYNWALQFFTATRMLQEPFEKVLEDMNPPPSCLISDFCLPWTTNVAHKFCIPRILFHGMCCLSLLCTHNLLSNRVLFDDLESPSDSLVVPGLPDRIELTKAQIPTMVYPKTAGPNDLRVQYREAEKGVYGIVVNSFEELEGEYVKEYSTATGKKVWCVGPVSLSNESNADKADRGNNATIDKQQCLKWLDKWDPSSVVYVCLGSLARLPTVQMIELGLGLEESNRPFIWCIRYESEEFKEWVLDEGYEDRIRGMGLLIRGWAPQVMILSHPSVGVFLTHCGWNSTVEGVSAGVPMMTWPVFLEQFCNEKLVVEVLRIGEPAGVKVPILFGEEEKVGVLVKKEEVRVVIERLMDEGVAGEERRKRAREFGVRAKRAIEEGGSSYLNITMLVQDIMDRNKQIGSTNI